MRDGGGAMALADEVKKLFWFHTIDLGEGVVTPGHKSAAYMQKDAAAYFDGVDLRGKSFLDVGAWNGGFCVEAAKRGAARIVGLDSVTWNSAYFRGRETFDLVSRRHGNRFEAIDIDVDRPGLDLGGQGPFDVVLYAGVFYHLVDPIAATREVGRLAKELLILETYVDDTLGDRPAMVFYPGSELGGDPSNWWGPNVACVSALLRQFGFPRVEVRNGSDHNRKVFHAYAR